MLRFLLVVAIVIASIRPVLVSPAWADEIHFLRIGTGATSGTYFVIGGLLANAISNPPGSRACEAGGSCGVPGLIAAAQSTQGSLQNIDLIEKQTIETALVQSDVTYYAFNAQASFIDQPPKTRLRVIASLYPETLHVVVRAESKITRIDQLRGRTVSLGEPFSGTAATARLVLQEYGVLPKALTDRQLKPGQASDALAAGKIDAFFILGGYPLQVVTALAQRLPIRLLPVAPKEAALLQESVIPDQVYPKVDATPTVQVKTQWVVSADMSADRVYALTKALWQPVNIDILKKGHPQGEHITQATALDGFHIPLHPGAEQYYIDHGMLEAVAAPAYLYHAPMVESKPD